MTIEEAIKCLKTIEVLKFKDSSETYFFEDVEEALDLAIKALEQQPCEDCISREQAIKQCGFGMTNLLIADCLRRLPSVTPQPKIGKWIKVDDEEPIAYDCSECGVMVSKEHKYCPNCGAEMEVEDNGKI